MNSRIKSNIVHNTLYIIHCTFHKKNKNLNFKLHLYYATHTKHGRTKMY